MIERHCGVGYPETCSAHEVGKLMSRGGVLNEAGGSIPSRGCLSQPLSSRKAQFQCELFLGY